MAETIDWVERLPWSHEDPDRDAKHPSIQRLTDAEIEERLDLQRLRLAEEFTHGHAEEAGEDLDAYRADIREGIATYERALELRRGFPATSKEAG